MMTPHTNPSPLATSPATKEEAQAGRLAPVGAQARMLAFEPKNFAELVQLGDLIATIRLGDVANPADAIGRMMFGASIGLSAIVSVNNIFPIPAPGGGVKYSTYAVVARALANQHPSCEYLHCTEFSPDAVTFELKRKDRAKAQSVRWTIEDAQRAGLVDRGKDKAGKDGNNYNKYPRDMLVARASVGVIRLELPEVLIGLGILDSGFEDEAAATPAHVEYEQVPQAQKRDWAAERKTIEAAIEAMASEADLVSARNLIAAFEADGQSVADLKALYAKKKKPVKAAAEPSPAPVAPTSAPAAEAPKAEG